MSASLDKNSSLLHILFIYLFFGKKNIFTSMWKCCSSWRLGASKLQFLSISFVWLFNVAVKYWKEICSKYISINTSVKQTRSLFFLARKDGNSHFWHKKYVMVQICVKCNQCLTMLTSVEIIKVIWEHRLYKKNRNKHKDENRTKPRLSFSECSFVHRKVNNFLNLLIFTFVFLNFFTYFYSWYMAW